MDAVRNATRTHGAPRTSLRPVTCAAMVLAAAALVAAIAFGAPLVSILFVGLLLLCPLFTWAPFRASRQPGPPEGETNRKEIS